MAPDDVPEDPDPGRRLDRGKLKLKIKRRLGEAVVIGDVRVTVAEIRPREVRLFIEAPKCQQIHLDPR